jgi:hypothetical protein
MSMLSMLWLFPLVVAAAAVVPIWRATQRLGGEAAELRVSIAELARLRPLVADVRAEIIAVGATPGRPVRDLGPR